MIYCERRKRKRDEIDSPTDPVPSMIPETVASAREFDCKVGCVPKSAETAVVISAYGPFTNKPSGIRRPDWKINKQISVRMKLLSEYGIG